MCANGASLILCVVLEGVQPVQSRQVNAITSYTELGTFEKGRSQVSL